MDDNINSFFNLGERKIKIGDYYYSDGTLSHEYYETKDCIGIVFSIIGTFEYPNGSVVALSDAKNHNESNLHLWRNSIDKVDDSLFDEKNDKIREDHDDYKKDFGGFFYSQNITEEYEAINAAINFPVNLSKDKTSGWYLPSSGQMKMIAQHFVHNDDYEKQKMILNLADVYMVSQPRERIYPLCIDLKDRKFMFENADYKSLVRPVFSI